MAKNLTIEQSLLLELQGIREEIYENRFGSFNPDSLAWLALVPVWTESLAESVRFPTGDLSLEGFLNKAQKSGLCTTKKEPEIQGKVGLQFWVPKDNLDSLLDYLKKEMGNRWLQDRAFRIANLVLKNMKGDIPIHAETTQWAELAITLKAGPEETSNFLDQKIFSLVGLGRTGEAIEWTNTGLRLAGAVEGNLRNTIVAGKKYIELAYRARHDQYYLRDYLEIKDQIEAFRALMRSDGHPWALHFVGMGGVGKTMLMRYISHHHRDEYITSRVDFDHLSPEYPRRRPGQLLIYFAEELRMFSGASSQQAGLFASLRRKVDALHNKLAEIEKSTAQGGTPIDIDQVIESQEFESILNDFSGIISLMTKQVVLILDTCEELLKLHPINGRLQHLEITFKILEKLNRMEPRLRVVFAGRRLLAKKGFEWKAGPMRTTYLPELKDYLALHPIRGFTQEQAIQFLREKKQLVLDQDFENAILNASTDIGDPIDLEYGHLPDWEVDRYNPFDLSLYADWIKQDEKVTLEMIQSGEIDPYIAYRIIDRLEKPLQHLVPGMAQLGRFDKEMLHPVFKSQDKTSIEEAFLRLGEQEWIDHVPNPSGEMDTYLQVEANLFTRLKRYYQAEANQDDYIRAGNELGPHLAEMALNRNLAAVNEDLVGPALRLLNPAAVTKFWDDLERRFIERGQWNRLKDLLENLPGGSGSIEDPDHPAHAQYLATMLAIKLHPPERHLPILMEWAEIDFAAEDTDNSFKTWLQTRAAIGMAASYRMGSEPKQIRNLARIMLSFPNVGAYLPKVDAHEEDYYRIQLAASLCASLDQMLRYGFDAAPKELNESEKYFLNAVIGWGLDPTHPWDIVDGEVHLADPDSWDMDQTEELNILFPPQISLFALLLAARAGGILNFRFLNKILERVHKLLESWTSEPPPTQFFDWVPPDSMVDYARLETLLLAPPVFTKYMETEYPYKWAGEQNEGTFTKMLYKEEFDGWMKEALPRMRVTSSERLVSRILQLSMANSLNVNPDMLTEIESYQVGQAEALQFGISPQLTPPLAVTLAQGWSDFMNPERAFNLLRDTGKKLRGASKENLAQEIKRAQLVVARQTRLIQPVEDEYAKRALSVVYEDNAVAWPLNALVGADSTRGPIDITIDTGSPGKPELATYPITEIPLHLTEAFSDRRLALWWRCQSTLSLERKKWVLETFYKLAKDRFIFTPEEAPDRESLELGICAAEYNRLRANDFPDMPPLPSEYQQNINPDREEFNPTPYIQDLLKLPPWFTEEDLRLALRVNPDSKEILDHGIVRFGERRVGQIVIEEAELLALRLPIPALDLLTIAHNLFMSAGDNFNGLKTAILGVITATHGAVPEISQPWFENHLMWTYKEWEEASQPRNLPTWTELTREITLDDITRQRWEVSGLGGWWHRLVACVLWNWQPDSSERERIRIQRWMDDTYQHIQPIELDRKVQYKEALPQLVEDEDNKTGEVVGMVLFFLLIIGVLVGGYFLVGWLIKQFIWSAGVRWYWQLLIYIGILISLAVLPGKVNLKGWFFSVSRIRFDIHKEVMEPNAEAGFRLDMLQRERRRFIFIPLWLKELEFASYKVPFISLGNYQEEARKFPEEIKTLVSSWSQILPPHRLAIQINPDLQSIQVPWEAMLNFNSRFPDKDSAGGNDLSVIPDLRPNALQFYRVNPSIPTRQISLGQVTNIRNQVVVLSSPAWQALIERGWGRIRIRFLDQVVGGLPQDTERMSRVLHLVGTPVGPSDNVLMDLGQSNVSEKMPVEQSVLYEDYYRNTIAPGDLYVRYYPLIILQAEPAESKIRVASERERMGLLHAFASDLLRLGARSVIVLPPLEEVLVAQVLADIRKRLPRFGVPHLRRLLKIIETAKATIKTAKDVSTSPDILDELAQDVTLYYSGPYKVVSNSRPKPGSKSVTV